MESAFKHPEMCKLRSYLKKNVPVKFLILGIVEKINLKIH